MYICILVQIVYVRSLILWHAYMTVIRIWSYNFIVTKDYISNTAMSFILRKKMGTGSGIALRRSVSLRSIAMVAAVATEDPRRCRWIACLQVGLTEPRPLFASRTANRSSDVWLDETLFDCLSCSNAFRNQRISRSGINTQMLRCCFLLLYACFELCWHFGPVIFVKTGVLWKHEQPSNPWDVGQMRQ